MLSRRLIFRQLFDRSSCTYTYLLGDPNSKLGLLIDPVLELVDRDAQLIHEIGIKLRYIINTHVHADHVTGSGKLKQMLNASGNKEVQTLICKDSGAKADVHVLENDEIRVGDAINLKVLQTPGHTNGCMSLVDHNHGLVFTGDALFIRGCGRTDFQGGSSLKLYENVHQKLFTLPEEFLVYPAHDYKGHSCSTIREEKLFNPRLTKTKQEFVEIMENLKLDKPKLIDIAVPRNLVCGL